MFQYRMKDMLGIYTQDILGDNDAELAAMASAPFPSCSSSPLEVPPLPPSGAEEEVEIIMETPSSTLPSPSLLPPPPPQPLRRGPPPSTSRLPQSLVPFEDDGGALISLGEALLPIDRNWTPPGQDL